VLTFLDIHTSGTLADLAQTRADLAIIALAPETWRLHWRWPGAWPAAAALIISSGIDAPRAAELKKIALREGVALLGPNCLGLQRPRLQLNASAAGPLARTGSLALVSQSGALTASMLDWAGNNAVGFSSVVSLGPHTGVDIAEVLDFPGQRWADPKHRGLSGRHFQRAPFHECPALGSQCQTRGGSQGRAQTGRQCSRPDPQWRHRRQ
jgi:acetyltransferase